MVKYRSKDELGSTKSRPWYITVPKGKLQINTFDQRLALFVVFSVNLFCVAIRFPEQFRAPTLPFWSHVLSSAVPQPARSLTNPWSNTGPLHSQHPRFARKASGEVVKELGWMQYTPQRSAFHDNKNIKIYVLTWLINFRYRLKAMQLNSRQRHNVFVIICVLWFQVPWA